MPKATFSVDEDTERELEELGEQLGKSKSEIVREAVEDYYTKEMRASQKFEFFLELYRDDIIDEEQLYLLLPEKDAEAIVIGAEAGKEAAEVV